MLLIIKLLVIHIFFMKNEEENEKSYTYHRTYKEYYHLSSTDRNCLDTAKYNNANGKIEINTKYSIKYEDYLYINEKLIKHKIMRKYRNFFLNI